ncbi:MAG: hypothetical protein QME49_04395 [bacterium]|nr:hypothetical protein [bacterium]
MRKKDVEQIRRHEGTGCPLGDESFINRLEVMLGLSASSSESGSQT